MHGYIATACNLAVGCALITTMLVGSLGCGRDDGRLAIRGSVKLDGQPLEQGSISFASVAAGSKSTTGGPITNGEYSISAEDGLEAGAYRVTISAADTSNATPEGLPADGLAFPSLIPPEFNRARHQVELTPDGPNTFPFDIPKTVEE